MPIVRPKPRQVSHAPTGELKENRLGCRLLVGAVALRAVQLARVAPGRELLRRVAVVDDVHVDAAAANAQRGLERFEHAAALGCAGAEAVLHDLEHRRGVAPRRRLAGRACCAAPEPARCAAAGARQPRRVGSKKRV